jgi:hypothetical protein
VPHEGLPALAAASAHKESSDNCSSRSCNSSNSISSS